MLLHVKDYIEKKEKRERVLPKVYAIFRVKTKKIVKISPYLTSFFFLPGESAAGLWSLLWPGVHVL